MQGLGRSINWPNLIRLFIVNRMISNWMMLNDAEWQGDGVIVAGGQLLEGIIQPLNGETKMTIADFIHQILSNKIPSTPLAKKFPKKNTHTALFRSNSLFWKWCSQSNYSNGFNLNCCTPRCPAAVYCYHAWLPKAELIHGKCASRCITCPRFGQTMFGNQRRSSENRLKPQMSTAHRDFDCVRVRPLRAHVFKNRPK